MSFFSAAVITAISDARSKLAEAVPPDVAAALEAAAPEEPQAPAWKRVLGGTGGALAGDVGGVLLGSLLARGVSPGLGLAALLAGPAAGAAIGSHMAGGSGLEAALAGLGAGAAGATGKALGVGSLMAAGVTQGKRNSAEMKRLMGRYLAGAVYGGTAGGLAGSLTGAGLEALR